MSESNDSNDAIKSEGTKITFKRKKHKPLRQRVKTESESEEEDSESTL